MPQVPAELTWAQVHSFRLERHHLTQRAPKKDLSRVVGEIAGAQAQLMSAAELQVGVRVDCRTSDVRDALWKDRTLVKTWLMRGTLHLIPAADLALYTSAMGTRWIKTRNSWLKFFQLSEAELMDALLNEIDKILVENGKEPYSQKAPKLTASDVVRTPP